MLPILITHDARAPTIQVRALKRRRALETAPRAQNGNAARSKRRYALKTALRVQTVLRAQNGAARSNEVRQGVGKLVRRGRQGSAD